MQIRLQTYCTTHHRVKLVLVETFVDRTTTGFHIATESLPVIAACQEQLTVLVVVVGLQLGDSQQL